MFKVNNKDTRVTSSPDTRQWRRSGVLTVFISADVTYCSRVYIIDFEQVNAGWDILQYDITRVISLNRCICGPIMNEGS